MPDTDEFATNLMDDMDPQLLELIQTRINSFIKWDLVRFFHDNPHTTDTADSIARYTGRDVRTVEPELIQLARDGLLDMEDLSGLRVFTLAGDPDIRELVAQFIAACDDRQFRVKAIYHVIRSLR
ncbi:MAG: acyl--CoA ligase [Chloroflexi bacterium]|nr:acyl--CoA ligase [Chloroflexota bacterium]